MDFELSSTIEEVVVAGDVAWSRLHTELDCIPRNGDPTARMAGHTLTIWRRVDGAWRIVRASDTVVAAG